jgi:hypothetical protein
MANIPTYVIDHIGILFISKRQATTYCTTVQISPNMLEPFMRFTFSLDQHKAHDFATAIHPSFQFKE